MPWIVLLGVPTARTDSGRGAREGYSLTSVDTLVSKCSLDAKVSLTDATLTLRSRDRGTSCRRGDMDKDFLLNQILRQMRLERLSPEEAARTLSRGFKVPYDVFAEALESIQTAAEVNDLLDGPTGVVDKHVHDEAKHSAWYSGQVDGVDLCWPNLRVKFESGGMRDAVEDIDRASTKVVAQLANPLLHGVSKRGLVLGYVQSGKTANFTSVMAKAADAGYSLFIVLSGLHNNLRRQTQVRLDNDLMDETWHPLTNADADFTNSAKGAALANKHVKSLAVVKKNQSRLRSLRDWLRDIPIEIRRKVPILLLDDEADQATPNSATAKEEHTRINELIRQIWREIPTGTYLGYTATPFANVFMDPSDEEELYPADFIIDLPRPAAYFGAERIFGREPVDDADDPDPGLDMIRYIPMEDVEVLKAPGKRADRESFDPELPESLIEAVRWFVIASAVRRVRGQVADHSSMLVHTTHYIAPHFMMKRRVERLLDDLLEQWAAGDRDAFADCYVRESGAVAGLAGVDVPEWEHLEGEVERVLEDVRVVVDNGDSEDRLDYDRRDPDGNTLPETVIAIGGGTLSRGLTLEGLIVSYFTRTSNTYDTLLQMGRWFGFRLGYEDLPRMWLQRSLADEFRFLALVEEEIRRDIRDMARKGQTPQQLGVRVRSHPGRLEIVARNKMSHANKVSVTYSGQRLQTFLFVEDDDALIQSNLASAKRFIENAIVQSVPRPIAGRARWLLSDVPTAVVLSFLEEYAFHHGHTSMAGPGMTGWIRQAVPDALWNVVVAGGKPQYSRPDGSPLDLGSVDLGLGEPVPTVNRAPLVEPDSGEANIKALLSKADWFADLSTELVARVQDADQNPQATRRELAQGRGLIILMPVSRHSIPLRNVSLKSRREMRALDHLLGVGIIFPEVPGGSRDSGEYYSVLPDWEPEAEEEDDLPEDREGDFVEEQP